MCKILKFGIKKIFLKHHYMTARFLPVRGKAEKSLCTLTTEYTAHLIHSFCCSERASHTSGRTITVKTAGCFLLTEKYYSIDAGKILFSEYSRNIRKIYCYSAFRTWTLQRLCSEGDDRQRGTMILPSSHRLTQWGRSRENLVMVRFQ